MATDLTGRRLISKASQHGHLAVQQVTQQLEEFQPSADESKAQEPGWGVPQKDADGRRLAGARVLLERCWHCSGAGCPRYPCCQHALQRKARPRQQKLHQLRQQEKQQRWQQQQQQQQEQQHTVQRQQPAGAPPVGAQLQEMQKVQLMQLLLLQQQQQLRQQHQQLLHQ